MRRGRLLIEYAEYGADTHGGVPFCGADLPGLSDTNRRAVMSAVWITTVWLRRMRRLTYAVVGPAVAVGLGFTWRAAWHGDVVQAVVGAAATLAMLGAGVMWGAALRAGLATIRTGRRLERLERYFGTMVNIQLKHQDRLEELADGLEESRLQATQTGRDLETKLDQSRRRLTERLDGLLARVGTYSKLHDDQAERLEQRIAALESAVRRGAAVRDVHTFEDRDWAVQDTPPGERTVAAYRQLVEQGAAADGGTADESAERRALRQEFAGFIHRRDYVKALSAGDQIVERFPHSTAASDFRRVKPHLVRRIELAERAASRSGR